MRILVTGAGVAATLLVMSCSVKKLVTSEQTMQASRTEEKVIEASLSRKLDWEYLGDSLSGRVPLPYTVPKPASYQIYAGGVTLDVTLRDSTLEYRSVAKPVARSRLIQEDSAHSITQVNEEILVQEKQSEVKKRVGLPWWIWPILILVIALAILAFLRKFKFPF